MCRAGHREVFGRNIGELRERSNHVTFSGRSQACHAQDAANMLEDERFREAFEAAGVKVTNSIIIVQAVAKTLT